MHRFHGTLFVGGFCMMVAFNNYADTAEGSSGIKALMTPEQYDATGLSKLSEEEREALYKWLRRYAEDPESIIIPAAAATPQAPAAGNAIVATPTAKTAAIEKPVPAAIKPKTATAEPAVAEPPVSTLSVTDPAPTQPPAAKLETAASPPLNNAADDKYFGLPAPPVETENNKPELHAKVLPPFRGWSGKTVFKLDNGQVWKQRSSGRHTYTGDDTRVVISQNRMGFFELRLLAADRSVGVKRVR